MRPILDPRLKASLTDYYPSICVVWDNNRVQQEDTGQWVEGTPTEALRIPCRIGPLILIRPTDNEDRLGKETREVKTRQVDLDSYHPEIDITLNYVVVDGVKFNILGNESDGNKFKTRLRLEVIEPNG